MPLLRDVTPQAPRRRPAIVAASFAGLVAVLLAATPAGAAFPGENGRIAFGSGGFEPAVKREGIYLTDAQGTVVTRIASGLNPSFSADGARIAFDAPRSDRTGKYSTDTEILTMNSDGTGLRPVTGGEGYGNPSISPRGEIVFQAFTSSPRPTELLVIDADGTNERRLTSGDSIGFDPAFSPDGEQVVFAREEPDPDGGPARSGIYIVNADGTGLTQLTDNPSSFGESSPTFSPDGEHIVFARFGGGIFRIDRDGSDLIRLTNRDSDSNPSYSPDGDQIAFSRDSVERCVEANLGLPQSFFLPCADVFVMDADGTEVRQVTAGGYGPGSIDWGVAGPPLGPQSARCGGRRATIVATDLPDIITGTPRRDVIAGLGGGDQIEGAGGNDVICGAGGQDRIFGGPGADRLFGQGAGDLLVGGPGRDLLSGGPGADFLVGEGGRDTLRGAKGDDILDGGPGRDRCNGGPGRNRLERCE